MKKIALWIAALAVVTSGALNAQEVVGDWLGTLAAGGVELHLALHISKAADGTLKGTLDSIDQGANGIPVDPITLKDSKLNLTVAAVNGGYEGKVNADGTIISGTWTQGQPLPLEFRRGVVAKVEHKPGKPTDIDGTWQGEIDTGQATLRMVFHIVNTEDGLMATLDVPDQNIKGVPVTSVTRNGSMLKLEMKALAGGYDGKIATDLSIIDGTWTQAGNSITLKLKR
jgi:serine-type D-Ala-D-Ala carboxypeptidase/endopeptidase